jgi:hypothetical protein
VSDPPGGEILPTGIARSWLGLKIIPRMIETEEKKIDRLSGDA